MTASAYERGGGVVPIDLLAADNGTSVAEAKKSLAELSAFGIVRLALGPDGEVPRLKASRTLTILNEGGGSGCHALFLDRPAGALPPFKRRRLAEMVGQRPGLSLGALAMLCASVRLANGVGVARYAALEDYLGLVRGGMKGKEAHVDP